MVQRSSSRNAIYWVSLKSTAVVVRSIVNTPIHPGSRLLLLPPSLGTAWRRTTMRLTKGTYKRLESLHSAGSQVRSDYLYKDANARWRPKSFLFKLWISIKDYVQTNSPLLPSPFVCCRSSSRVFAPRCALVALIVVL